MDEQKMIYGADGFPVKNIPNLDPNFFLSSLNGANITLGEMDLKPYQYHAYINAGGRVISSNIARLPKVLYKQDNPSEFITDHDVLNLFKNPNLFMETRIVFWQAVVLSLLLPCKSSQNKDNTGGQVFLVCLKKNGEKVNLRKGEIPEVIYPYNSSLITPWKIHDQFKGWIYEVPGHKDTRIEFENDEIIRINFFNPYDWLSGLSYFTPAYIAFMQDVRATVFNAKFFDNNATVSGLLTSDQHLNDEQFRSYLKRWMENFGGLGNNNRTAVLGMGLKYQQFGIQHADMQFTEQRKLNMEEMLATFGLNKIAVGNYEDINYATIREGRRLLWQDTYMPIDTQINEAINDQWVSYIEPDLRLRSDYSEIEALREDYKQRAESARVMVEGLTFPPVLAANLNNIPLTKKNLKEYPWLGEKVERVTSAVVDSSENKKLIITKKNLNDDYLEKFSDEYIKSVLEPGEKKFIIQLERFFISQRNRMQDKVDEWLKHQEKILKVLNISPQLFLLDALKENESLAKLVTPLVMNQLKSEKEQLITELGSLIEWDVTNEKLDFFIKTRKEEIKQINTTTFKAANKKIGEAIEESIHQNLTPQKTAKLVKEAISDVGEIRKNQSKMIARTETGIIHGSARFEAFHVEGFTHHKWLTAKDEKVRDLHRDTNNVIAQIGSLFMPVGLRFPSDPRGLPGNIINCRCVAIVVAERDG